MRKLSNKGHLGHVLGIPNIKQPILEVKSDTPTKGTYFDNPAHPESQLTASHAQVKARRLDIGNASKIVQFPCTRIFLRKGWEQTAPKAGTNPHYIYIYTHTHTHALICLGFLRAFSQQLFCNPNSTKGQAKAFLRGRTSTIGLFARLRRSCPFSHTAPVAMRQGASG